MHARIKCLADMFPRDNCLLDIGSDHGYLGIELLRSEKAMEVWNVDLSKESLKNSKRVYEREGLCSRAKFICSNGFQKLDNIPPNAVVVVAGLGSSQILKILEDMPKAIRSLILMSHTDYFPIRKWAHKNNWNIHEEKYLEERGYYYMAMRLLRSSGRRDEYTEEEYIFGKEKFRKSAGDLFVKYWQEKARRLLKIPEDHRNSVERRAIGFLFGENIVHSLRSHEDS